MARQNPFSPDEPLHECSRGYSIAHGYSSPVLPYYSSKQRPFFFPPATQAGVDPTLKTSIFTKPPPLYFSLFQSLRNSPSLACEMPLVSGSVAAPSTTTQGRRNKTGHISAATFCSTIAAAAVIIKGSICHRVEAPMCSLTRISLLLTCSFT